jgi:hypothetical protein
MEMIPLLADQMAGKREAVRAEIYIDRAFVSLFVSQMTTHRPASTLPGNPLVEGGFPVLGDIRHSARAFRLSRADPGGV